MTGEELYEIFREKRLRPTDVANMLGVKPQNITSIFNSPDVPSGKLEKIASVLGYDMSFWYPAIRQSAVPVDMADSAELTAMVQSITDENKRLALANSQLTATNAQLSQIISNLTRSGK